MKALSSYPLDNILRVDRSLPAAFPDPMGFRVCVTGGRDITDRGYVWGHLDSVHFGEKYGPILELGAGCARGVDRFSLEWADNNRVPWRMYVADWDRYAEAAGAMRNEAMLVDFEADRLLVFEGGVGTTDCARKCRKLFEKKKLHTERDFFPLDLDPFNNFIKWG